MRKQTRARMLCAYRENGRGEQRGGQDDQKLKKGRGRDNNKRGRERGEAGEGDSERSCRRGKVAPSPISGREEKGNTHTHTKKKREEQDAPACRSVTAQRAHSHERPGGLTERRRGEQEKKSISGGGQRVGEVVRCARVRSPWKWGLNLKEDCSGIGEGDGCR